MRVLRFVFLGVVAAGLCPAPAHAGESKGDAGPASSSGGFDEELKIWFPPGAPKTAYLARDPNHSFSQDLRKAFSNPALRESVCATLGTPAFAPDPALESSVRQLRTMEDMMCIATAVQEKAKVDKARREENASDLLATWFAEDRAAAEKMRPEDRRTAEFELRYTAYQLPMGNERARAGVKMIALRPSDDMAIAFLLEHGAEATYGTPGPGDIESAGALPGEKPRFHVSKDHVRQFVTDLYRSMIEAEGPAAGPFRSGWAGYLHLSGGDLAEARKLAAAYVSDPADDNPAFETIFVAYLDRLLCDGKPLADLVAHCPFPPQDAVAAELSENYCRTIGWSLAKRLIEVRGRDASPIAAQIVREALRAEPVNWMMRMESIRTLDRLDRGESAREYQAVVDLPATVVPKGIRLDAIGGVMVGFMDRTDYRSAFAVNQRWLDTYGYEPAALPEDGWSRLAAVEKIAESSAPCDDALACMLNKRIWIAIRLKEMKLARKTLEERLAYSLDARFAEETRVRLEEMAQTELDVGNRTAALRIVRYLWPQPKDPILAQLLKQQRQALSPPDGSLPEMTHEDRPWDSESFPANR